MACLVVMDEMEERVPGARRGIQVELGSWLVLGGRGRHWNCNQFGNSGQSAVEALGMETQLLGKERSPRHSVRQNTTLPAGE